MMPKFHDSLHKNLQNSVNEFKPLTLYLSFLNRMPSKGCFLPSLYPYLVKFIQLSFTVENKLDRIWLGDKYLPYKKTTDPTSIPRRNKINITRVIIILSFQYNLRKLKKKGLMLVYITRNLDGTCCRSTKIKISFDQV